MIYVGTILRQQPSDNGHEFRQLERLAKECLELLLSGLAHSVLIQRTHEHHRDRFVVAFAHRVQHARAVQHRHHIVQQHQLGLWILCQALQALPAIRRRDDAISLFLEYEFQQFRDTEFVIDDEDRAHQPGSRFWRRRTGELAGLAAIRCQARSRQYRYPPVHQGLRCHDR